MEKQLQKGQVLLIVVLVMVVALTVGLSVASRSITNLRITTDDENSQRAFSAAEAGIERAVKGNCTDTTNGCIISKDFSEGFSENKTTFETKVTPILGAEFLVKGGVQVKQDEGSDVWLSQYSTDPSELYTHQWNGDLTVYWGDTSADCSNLSTVAALQVMVLAGDRAALQNATLTQYAFDPCASSRGNNFSPPTTSSSVQIDSQTFTYGATISIANGLLMRVIPLYTNTTLGIKKASGTEIFPIQGQQIISTGASGGTVRKVTFIQSYASIPSEFFQYALISP